MSASSSANSTSVSTRFWQRRVPLLREMEAIRVYLYVVAVATFSLVVWMSFVHIDRVVRVAGKVIPAGRSQEIQHLEGGIVAAIMIHEGQAVKKGDVLLTIEDTKAGADLGETTATLTSQEARAARLHAEASGAERVEFPESVRNTPSAVAEQQLFESRKAKRMQELTMHRNALAQQKAHLSETQRRMVNLKKELYVASQRLELMRSMKERRAASQLEVLDAQSAEQNLRSQLSEAEASIPTINAAIAEEQARLEGAEADFRSQAQADRVTALAEIDRVKQLKISASDRMQRTEVRAPSDGIINHVLVNTVGGVVRPGEALVELIPHTDAVLIEAQAEPRNRGYLKPGLDANIRISAYDTGELGTLKGKVTQVSADSLAERDGTYFYRVNLLIDHIPPSYKNHELVPGMTATADIVTGERTMMGMLLAPLRKFTYSMFKDAR